MLGLGRDPEELAGLKVDRNLDGEAGIAVEALVRCHQQTLFTRLRSRSRSGDRPGKRRGSFLAMLLSGITSLGKTVLLIAAITFIVWAIVTAIFVPKRNPGFPRRLDAYILVSAILFLTQMTAIVWVSETQEVEEAHAAEGEGGPPGEGEGGAPAGDVGAGKTVFESAGCATCHVLADAGASGTVGPDLDASQPPPELVVERVTNGQGAMPSFADQLSDEEIMDVAAYVSSVAGS